MKESEWIGKICSSMVLQCKKRGYAAPGRCIDGYWSVCQNRNMRTGEMAA